MIITGFAMLMVGIVIAVGSFLFAGVTMNREFNKPPSGISRTNKGPSLSNLVLAIIGIGLGVLLAGAGAFIMASHLAQQLA